MSKHIPLIAYFLLSLALAPASAFAQNADSPSDASAIVKRAVDYYRGEASVSRMDMIIHRPEWERTVTIKAWTRGQKDSLFHITAPPKDKGNGTLKKGREMWTFNPKVNRVIKLPPSMMSQSWMGSDFSNDDLAKSDAIVDDYEHSLESVQSSDGLKVFVIKSVPKPAAPVVWGMQKLHVREDNVLLKQEFFDEEMQPVKAMTGSEIQTMGGKLFPKRWRMQKTDADEEYTELVYHELEFLDGLPESLFTIASLKNPGR